MIYLNVTYYTLFSLLGGRRREGIYIFMRSLLEINTQMDTHLWLMYLDIVARVHTSYRGRATKIMIKKKKKTKNIQDWSHFSFSSTIQLQRGPEFYLNIKQRCHFKCRRISLLFTKLFLSFFLSMCEFWGWGRGEVKEKFSIFGFCKLWYILLEAVLVFWVVWWWLFTHSLLVI